MAGGGKAQKKKKQKKPMRPKARRPRGFEDKPGDLLRAERELIARACAVYEAHGFEPLDTPALEFADALGKFLPDADRPNEGVFAFQDDDDQWLSMRYDLTAPLARHVAEHFDGLAKPYRRYQYGPVYRNEKPGPGRFREFIQCDADTVGAGNPAADAEMIALAVKVMRGVGLTDGEYAVRINDRRLLDGLMAKLGVPDTQDGAVQRMTVLRAIDKMDRLGPDGVAALLGDGRKDESGDYTDGAKLAPAGIDAVMGFVSAGTEARADTMAAIERAVGPDAKTGLEALAVIDTLLEAMGIAPSQAVFDPAIVRGLGYYTGPVFEAELLLEVNNDKGQPVRVGSVGGGGRYDDLVSRFKGQTVPATGFSFGVSRFATALRLAGRLGNAQDTPPLTIITAMEADQMGAYFALAERLRGELNAPVEVFVGGGNMGKQLKYADKRGARFAIIIGEDERKTGQSTVKDLALGAALAANITSNAEWRAGQPAQETMPQSDLPAWIKRAMAGTVPSAAAPILPPNRPKNSPQNSSKNNEENQG